MTIAFNICAMSFLTKLVGLTRSSKTVTWRSLHMKRSNKESTELITSARHTVNRLAGCGMSATLRVGGLRILGMVLDG